MTWSDAKLTQIKMTMIALCFFPCALEKIPKKQLPSDTNFDAKAQYCSSVYAILTNANFIKER